jgi:hypothetical protein
MQWTWKGAETLHPYWAVRRATAAQLKHEEAKGNASAKFNCVTIEKQFSTVCVGAFGGESVSATAMVSVPLITNDKAIKAGDELVIEVREKAIEGKRKETWKDDVVKPKKKTKPKASPALNLSEV